MKVETNIGTVEILDNTTIFDPMEEAQKLLGTYEPNPKYTAFLLDTRGDGFMSLKTESAETIEEAIAKLGMETAEDLMKKYGRV